MVFTIIQFLFAFFMTTAVAQSDSLVSTSVSSTITVSQVGYPPRGLLDSIHSMKVREELYQNELSEVAARQLGFQPPFALPSTNPIPTGAIALLNSTQGLYSDSLLPDLNDESTTSPLPTSESSCQIPAITNPPTIRQGLPTPPPKMANYVTTQKSNAPQPHVLLSMVWVLVIFFIIGTTLYTALNGLGSFIFIFLALNVVCAIVTGAHAYPEPLLRPIGGLRPGPIGKIPCGSVRGRIGTNHGHEFRYGAERKIGRLRPVVEELICDDWSNAKSLFERGLVVPKMLTHEMEKTTTIYTTSETTVLVTVENTATQAQNLTSTSPSSTPFHTPASAIMTITKSKPSSSSLSSLAKIEQESSAVPSAVNIRTTTSRLFLLYFLGVFFGLLAQGAPGALSYVVISLTIIAVIGGAGAIAVPSHADLHYTGGRRVEGLEPAGIAKDRDLREVTVLNGTYMTGSVEAGKLKEVCSELYCHNWLSTEHETPTLTARTPTHRYVELGKRLSTEYVTVTPTSGIIGVFGPQIIPVTVESTAYERVTILTVDVERVRSTRTKFVTVDSSGPKISEAFLTMSKADLKSGLGLTILTASASDKPLTTIIPSAVLKLSMGEEKVSTVFVTITDSPLPASTVFVDTTVTAAPRASSSFSWDNKSSSESKELPAEASIPISLPAISSASRLSPSWLYLSFMETNLYCFIFLLSCLRML